MLLLYHCLVPGGLTEMKLWVFFDMFNFSVMNIGSNSGNVSMEVLKFFEQFHSLSESYSVLSI